MAARAPPWRVAALFCYDPSNVLNRRRSTIGKRQGDAVPHAWSRTSRRALRSRAYKLREPLVLVGRPARTRCDGRRHRSSPASAPRRLPPSGRCRAAQRWRASRCSRPSRRPWFGVARPRWMSKAASSRRCQRAMPSNATQRPRPCDWYRGRRRRGPRNRRAPTYPVGRRRRPRRTHRCTAAPGASPRRASRKKAAPT